MNRYRTLPDGSVWPTPGDEPADSDALGLEWRLRYARQSITDADLLVLASIVSAYRELIACPEARRRVVVREMRRALTQNEVQT